MGDEPLYRPVGTIADYFEDLEERAVAAYRKMQRPQLFKVPGGGGATYLQQATMLDLILGSPAFNPLEKKLDKNSRASLEGLLQEWSLGPFETAQAMDSRWEELIRSCAKAIVSDQPVPIGDYYLAPIMANANFMEPFVGDPEPYGLHYIVLPYVDAMDAPTSGGTFLGALRIWPGDDAILSSLYDKLHIGNEELQVVVSQFVASMP